MNIDEVDELFGNLGLIWGIHKIFLGELVRVANEWTPETQTGALIKMFAQAFKVYNFYRFALLLLLLLHRLFTQLTLFFFFFSGHVGLGMVALTKFKTKHERAKEFKQFIEEAEAHPECKETNLRRLLNVPVRRPGQYPLFVRTLQRATNKESNGIDFDLLESASLILEGK